MPNLKDSTDRSFVIASGIAKDLRGASDTNARRQGARLQASIDAIKAEVEALRAGAISIPMPRRKLTCT